MSQNESNSPHNITSAEVQALFDQGLRDGAQMLSFSEIVQRVAGSSTLALLTASAFIPLLPLVVTGGASGSVILTWLAGLGGNALAGWLANWAGQETAKLAFGDQNQQQLLIEQLAASLQSQVAGNENLQEELIRLLDETDGIAIAINSLVLRADAQTKLLNLLREDIQQGNIIQGRLHRQFVRKLDRVADQVSAKIESEGSFIRDQVSAKIESEGSFIRDQVSAKIESEGSFIRDQVSAKIESEGSFIRNMIQQQTEGSNAQLAILTDLITRSLSQQEAALSKSNDQSVVEAQIDIARKLVQDNHFVAAQTILVSIKDQHGESEITPESRARIANLLGCCAFSMGEFDTARSYFREAITAAPNNMSMITNDAMAALLSGKPEEALEISTKARNLNSRDPNATSVYIQALHTMGRHEELEEFLKNEHWIIEDPIGTASLASVKYELGEYQEAEGLLRRAIAMDATDAQMYILLANTILGPLAHELIEFGMLSNQNNERLNESEEALSQAVALYEKGDNREGLHAALVSRAGVRYIQGNLEAGLTDCERVLGENAVDGGALENKGRILLSLGRTVEAIRCFENILSQRISDIAKPSRYKSALLGGNRNNLPMLLASAYIDTRQFNQAINLLRPLFTPTPEDREQLGIAELLLIAQTAIHDNEAATDTVRIIEEIWAQNPEAKAVIAEHHAQRGNTSQAINLLKEATTLAEGSLRKRLTAQLAYLLYRQGEYAEAAGVLQAVVDKTRDNPHLRLYIVCLYNSKQLSEALQLTQLIRSTKGIVPGVSEIEALILEKGGDTNQAREIWQGLIEIEPSHMSHQVHAAYIEWRAGNRETAQQLALGIPFDRVKDDAILLIEMARLRAFLGLPEVLAFAYRARRIAFDNPEIHVQYLLLCLTKESEEHEEAQHEPSEVGVDTAVHLTRNGKTITFLILDEELSHKQPDELHISDPRAQKLLGKHKGERIVLYEGLLGEQEYEITEIQGKYVYASHQSIQLFHQGSLRHPDFDVSDVTEPGFMERFVQFLDRRAQQQPDIKALYTEQPLPLSAFARMIHRSMIDVWLAFIESDDERIFSAHGTQLEAATQLQILTTTKSVAIDLLTLLTIVHLSLEEAVAQRFDKILMPQALLDQLQEYEQELVGPQPSATVSSSAGQRYFLDIPAEYFQRKRELLNKVLTFVHEAVQVMPTMGIIEADTKFVGVVGKAATASILLAKEQEVPLYSDDLRLREVADRHWQVKGFDTQAILSDLRQRSTLSNDNYYNALSKLARSNYYYVRIDVDGLISILEQNRMEITPEVQSIFQLLHGPDCEMESAVTIIAELIKRIWIRSLLHHQKSFILDLALTTLFTGRRPSAVTPLLKVKLRQKFRLIPFKLPEILAQIDLWEQMVQ